METFTPKYRRNPNAKIHSLYQGVAPGNRSVTKIVKVAPDGNHLQAERVYGPGLQRGQGGRIGVFIMGGLETTLDEMEYILEAKRQKKFVPQRSSGEVAQMCHLLLERRNDAIRYFRRNPSEAPKPRKTVKMYLPVGCRWAPTSEPGLQVVVGG